MVEKGQRQPVCCEYKGNLPTVEEGKVSNKEVSNKEEG